MPTSRETILGCTKYLVAETSGDDYKLEHIDVELSAAGLDEPLQLNRIGVMQITDLRIHSIHVLLNLDRYKLFFRFGKTTNWGAQGTHWELMNGIK